VPSTQLIGLMKEGRLRALAAASSRRFPQLPDVPTLDESGIANMEVPNWIGLVAPSGTPGDIVARVNREVAASFSAPEALRVYEAWSMVRTGTGSEELAQKIARELAAWGPIIKKLNIALD
jgi:tripartite-type tricarboxylate transporter receptor subunit TctC